MGRQNHSTLKVLIEITSQVNIIMNRQETDKPLKGAEYEKIVQE